MEIVIGVVGATAAVFVAIFGGRGLVDLFQSRRRSRAAADNAPQPDTAVGVLDTPPPAPSTPSPAREFQAPPEPDPIYRRTFVGRDVELDALHKAFDEALDAHGSLAMVLGEPGIGKTSLTEQLAGYVAERGGKTLVGHCYEEGSLSLPYLAFVEAVRAYVLSLSDDDLRAQLGRGDDDLARIVPEIRERLQIEFGSPVDPEEERYRLLEAASDFLRTAATVQPLLIVLEDLHDADGGTLDMLTHLARNLSGAQLLVIGTYRDVEVDRAHPLSSSLAELHRVTTFARLQLHGLSQDEVHRMLVSMAGHDLPWRWAESVHRQTEGSPLFIQEVMRYLVEEGLVSSDEGESPGAGEEQLAARIPEGLRDVIGKRLSRLSRETNQMLSVASVVGREFSLEVLSRLVTMGQDELFGTLDEARQAAVLEERTGIGGAVSYRFTHAFFRQTLYEEMIAPRRIQLHQQVGRAIEEVHAGRSAEHAAELAEHFSHSSDPEDLAKAVSYGETAIDASMAVFAYGEAARLGEQAFQVQEVLDPADEAKRCDLLLTLGSALLRAGGPARVFEQIVPEALQAAQRIPDAARRRQGLVLGLGALTAYGGASTFATPRFQEWSEEAILTVPVNTAEHAAVEVLRARALRAAGRRKEGWQMAEHALDLAQALGDRSTLLLAYRSILNWAGQPSTGHKRLLLMDQVEAAGVEGGNFGDANAAWHQASLARLATGQPDRAGHLSQASAAMAERTRLPIAAIHPRVFSLIHATLEGHLEEAGSIADSIRDAATEWGNPRFGERFAANALFTAQVHLGAGSEPLEVLSQPDAVAGLEGDTRDHAVQRALCLAHLGRLDESRSLVEQIVATRDLADPDDDSPTWLLNCLLETAVLLGDRDLAATIVPRLVDLPIFFPTMNSFVGTCIARQLGDGHALLGDTETARRHYERALDECNRASYRPELALTRLGLARLLLDHHPDERADALEHLDFAITEFREMKMEPSLEKAVALKERA